MLDSIHHALNTPYFQCTFWDFLVQGILLFLVILPILTLVFYLENKWRDK